MTDLSGIQQAVQKIAEQSLKDQAKSGGLDKGAASAEDVQKLQQALNQPPAESNAANGPQQTQATDRVAGVEQVEHTNPGDRILQSLHRRGTEIRQSIAELSDALKSTDATSPDDLMRLQMKLHQVSMEVELGSKVAQKVDHILESLQKGS